MNKEKREKQKLHKQRMIMIEKSIRRQQKEIAEKYRKIEQIKKSISTELDKIANIEIDYE